MIKLKIYKKIKYLVVVAIFGLLSRLFILSSNFKGLLVSVYIRI